MTVYYQPPSRIELAIEFVSRLPKAAVYYQSVCSDSSSSNPFKQSAIRDALSTLNVQSSGAHKLKAALKLTPLGTEAKEVYFPTREDIDQLAWAIEDPQLLALSRESITRALGTLKRYSMDLRFLWVDNIWM